VQKIPLARSPNLERLPSNLQPNVIFSLERNRTLDVLEGLWRAVSTLFPTQ